jgi:hypothetical protein
MLGKCLRQLVFVLFGYFKPYGDKKKCLVAKVYWKTNWVVNENFIGVDWNF